MVKILVTGAGGQLGLEFQRLAQHHADMEFHFCTKSELDISNEKSLMESAERLNPDYLINCAAYTMVDKAEENPGLCFRINAESCRAIASVFDGRKTKIIHYSSDYVYHNLIGLPLKETDPTTPFSVYAQSKLQGEQWLRQSDVPTLIIRTSWVYSHEGSNFLQTMLRLASTKESIQVVYDQVGTPTYASDLAKATLAVIRQTENDEYGLNKFNQTYNYANEGVTSWYDFAVYILKSTGHTTKIIPITSDQFPTLATRPKWSLLAKEKIKTTFNLEIPNWMDATDRCLSEISKGKDQF